VLINQHKVGGDVPVH